MTEPEITAAALQFVRKVSGYRTPGRANAPAFEAAVAEVADATRRLLAALDALPHAATEAAPEHFLPEAPANSQPSA